MTDSTSGKPEEIAPANLDEVEDKELETEAAEDETGAGENDEEVDPADDTPVAANPASEKKPDAPPQRVYEAGQCAITVAVTFLPGNRLSVGAAVYGEAPSGLTIVNDVAPGELSAAAPLMQAAYEACVNSLPERGQKYLAQLEAKRKAEEDRKARIEASRNRPAKSAGKTAAKSAAKKKDLSAAPDIPGLFAEATPPTPHDASSDQPPADQPVAPQPKPVPQPAAQEPSAPPAVVSTAQKKTAFA